MPIRLNLDGVNQLNSKKAYYLSDTTGEIKEASFWMRFKCAIGVASARVKVTNLVDAVKTFLLERAGKSADAVLDAEIKNIALKSSVNGRALKDLATRFRAANLDAMIRREAEAVARQEAVVGFQYLHQHNLTCGLEQDILPIFSHAFKTVLNGKLPTTQDKSGRMVLDKDALSESLREVREKVTQQLLAIGNDARLGSPRIDRHYARHIITTFFKEDGTRLENGLPDLQTPDEAYAAYLYNLDNHNATLNSFVPKELAKQGRDTIAYARQIRELCGGDADLEDIVELGLRNICGTGDNKLRPDETVAKKIAALKDNLAEAREVEKQYPGFLVEFREAMYDMAGAAMPKGSIKRLAEAAGRADFSKLAKLSSFSDCGTILLAIDQLRIACDQLANPWQIFSERKNDIMDNGPEYKACRRIVQAIAVTKAGPAARQRIANAVNGTAFRQAAFVLEVRSNEASSTLYQGKERDARKRLFAIERETMTDLFSLFQPHDRPLEPIDTEDITWEQAMADNEEDFDEVFDAHVTKFLASDQA